MKNRVGLGTFPLANVFSKVTENNAEKIVHTFLDSGGYYIDTAPMYGFGEVERLLGKALKGYPRDKFYIATKCGFIDVEGKTFQTLQKSSKYEDIIRECEISLKRLNLDYIDLYFVHSPDPNTPFDETISALMKLQKSGKIKDIGVSNVNLKELKEYNKFGKVKYIQNRFSLINRSIDKDFVHYLLDKQIKLIPYQVIDRGQLSGKVFEGFENLRQGDLRIGRSDWLPEKVNIISDWVKENLSSIAKDLGITIGKLSISWALHQKFTGFVIVGQTGTEHLIVALKSNEIILPNYVLEKIDDAYYKLEKEIQNKYHQTIREFRGLNEKFY
ncbi:MAG: Aldo/keto reductase [Candidatus Gottesmanbacteria bacterium GW2011_GWA1_34_13]|uniref:Aldo/keto reductase n=1 Tax=Candidatus Gottesmanbacteria bacterium GW2011_GWA1_34_13 TaxID=1618434 RepID=A0A0G0AMS0_9BACT|nr:MAG: Aldo/keto reductase [Candidatus Gottesmanbacteria bacterium GW2011_GWA1_34_13]